MPFDNCSDLPNQLYRARNGTMVKKVVPLGALKWYLPPTRPQKTLDTVIGRRQVAPLKNQPLHSNRTTRTRNSTPLEMAIHSVWPSAQ